MLDGNPQKTRKGLAARNATQRPTKGLCKVNPKHPGENGDRFNVMRISRCHATCSEFSLDKNPLMTSAKWNQLGVGPRWTCWPCLQMAQTAEVLKVWWGMIMFDDVWSFLDDAWWRKRCEKVWEGVKTECEYMFLLGSPACILRLRLRTTRKANLPKDQNSKDVAQAQPLGLYAAWILTPTKCNQSFTCRTSAWTPANWLFLDSRL